MSLARHFCATCGKEGKDNKLCSKCHVAAYCSKECQDKDWGSHKKYCKHWVYNRHKDLQASGQAMKFAAKPESSAVFRAALQAARAKGGTEDVYVLMTAFAAERFAKTLWDDYLPSCGPEERTWGLWGEPSSPGYVRLLTAYQKAFKYGDLSATGLMEALCAKPNASKALTDLLQNTKIVCTETDSMSMNKSVTDRYLALVDGLEVVSEFDKWPIREEAAGAAAAGAAAAGAAAAGAAAAGASTSGRSR